MTTLEKLEELIYRSSQDAAQRSQEIDRRFQETDRLIKEHVSQYKIERKEMRKQFYGLTKSLGLFAESMVYPSAIPLFAQRGIALTGVSSRLKERRNGGTMEIDVLGAGPEAVVAIEAKSRLETDYVKDFLKRLPDFFEYFPLYRGRKLYGAVAGLSVDASAARYAYKKGLFVLVPAGELMQIWNDENFVPRVFGGAEKKNARRKK